MRNKAVSSRWNRLAKGLAIMVLSAGFVAGSAQTAAADVAPNSTPESAVTFGSVPYESYGTAFVDNPAATDPGGQRVADACNGGADVYGTAWWKYTAANESTFVVHAALAVGGPSVEEPIGMAVVSADLVSVACGTEGTSISDAGAFSLDAGESLYIVTYFPLPTEPTPSAPRVGVYPSSGVIPSNDDYASATPITSFPYSATQDTTLATREAVEPVCYSKFGVGPSVWYSVTVPTTQSLNVSVTTDFLSSVVVASSLDDQSSWLCDSPAEFQFLAEAGVTYRIGIYGVDQVRNSGQVTIEVGAAPSAPSVTLSIAASGKVNKKTGVVRLTGYVTCTGAPSTGAVTGSVSQVFKRQTHRQDFTGTAAACTGEPEKWKAVVQPSGFKFTGGKVQAAASVTACNTGGCTTADATAEVQLIVVR